MKKIITVFLTFCIVMSSMSVTASAETTIKLSAQKNDNNVTLTWPAENNITYNIYMDGKNVAKNNTGTYTIKSLDYGTHVFKVASTTSKRSLVSYYYDETRNVWTTKYIDGAKKTYLYKTILTDNATSNEVTIAIEKPVQAAVTQPSKPKPTTTKVTEEKKTVTLSEARSQMLKQINAERKKKGLKALKIDTKINKTAQAKANDMKQYNYFNHYSPRLKMFYNQYDKAKIKYKYGAENILKGECDAKLGNDAFMDSKPHRKNILSKKYTRVGIGKVNGYWVQQFAG